MKTLFVLFSSLMFSSFFFFPQKYFFISWSFKGFDFSLSGDSLMIFKAAYRFLKDEAVFVITAANIIPNFGIASIVKFKLSWEHVSSLSVNNTTVNCAMNFFLQTSISKPERIKKGHGSYSTSPTVCQNRWLESTFFKKTKSNLSRVRGDRNHYSVCGKDICKLSRLDVSLGRGRHLLLSLKRVCTKELLKGQCQTLHLPWDLFYHE